MASEGSRPLREAVEEAAKAAESTKSGPATDKRRGRPSDVFGGEIRRRDVFPLLVLHLIRKEPSYGNHLIEEIEEITQGVISVNPNTMYPLLRNLEADGMIEGKWEHPDRRRASVAAARPTSSAARYVVATSSRSSSSI